MLCSFLLFTDQLRMQTLHCDTLLMTETADVLFSLLISLGRVPVIWLFGRGGGGGVILRSIFTEYVPLVSQTIPWPIIDTIVVTFWLCVIL